MDRPTIEQVAEGLVSSNEFLAGMTYLKRSADSGGLTACVDALNAGLSDQEVLAGIFGSTEGYGIWS